MHHPSTHARRGAAILALCAFASTGCDAGDEPEAGSVVSADELPTPDGPEEAADSETLTATNRRYVGGDVVADLTLDGGTRVTFVAVAGDDGAQSVAVIEKIPSGGASLGDFDALTDAKAPALFWAVTEPGTPVPPALAALADADEQLGPQGWVLDSLADNPLVKPRSALCDSDAVFSSYVTNKNYANEVLRLNRHPDESSVFIEDSYAPGNGQVYDGYMYSPNQIHNGSRFFDLEAYYSRVGVCRISGHYVVQGIEIGPMIRFDRGQGAGWVNIFSEDVDWGDDPVTFAIHWTNLGQFDARTRIEMAAWDDIYDIGHAHE